MIMGTAIWLAVHILLLFRDGLSLQGGERTKSVVEMFRNVGLHSVQTTKGGTGGQFIGGMSTVGALRTRTTRPLEMAKAGADVSWFCTECGTEHVKWVGRCTACKEWNTVKEFRTPKSATLDTIDIRAAGSSQKVVSEHIWWCCIHGLFVL